MARGIDAKDLRKELMKLAAKHIDPVVLARQDAKARARTEVTRAIEDKRMEGWSVNPEAIRERVGVWAMDYLDPLLGELDLRKNAPMLLPPWSSRIAGYLALHLGAQGDVGDLIGLPQKFVGLEINGQLAERTDWSKPVWVPPSDGSWGNCVGHFEEINRVNREIATACLQILLEHMIHTHVLPDNFKLVASGNPPSGDYQVQEMDRALMDRICFLKFNPSLRAFIEWASGVGAFSEMLGFLSDNSEHLINDDGEYELNMEPSPRTWMKISHLEQVNLKHPAPPGVLNQAILGSIGANSGAVYIRYKEEGTEKVLRAEDIFESTSFPTLQLRDQMNQPPKMWFTTTMVCRWLAQRGPGEEKPDTARRFDQYVGALDDDKAYNLCFDVSQKENKGTLGHRLLSNQNCRNAMKVMERVIEAGEEYNVGGRRAA